MNNNWIDVTLIDKTIDVKLVSSLDLVNIKSFNEEAELAALEIAKTNKKIYISYSGGVDSEFVCDTFIKAKIPFEAVIYKFAKNGEYDTAVQYCNKNNIILNTIELNERSFLEHIVRQFHSKLITQSIGVYTHLFLLEWAEARNGICVTSDGNPTVDYSREFAYWDRNLVTNIFDLEHPAGFLSYSQELAYHCGLNNDESFHQQVNKCNLYNYAYRPKIDIFRQEKFQNYWSWIYTNNLQTKPFIFGNKKQFLDWITKDAIQK